jgi:nucleoid DNA-binding protein
VGFASLVDRVAVKVGRERRLSKLDVYAVVEAFEEELFDEIRARKRAAWPGRGVFRVVRRKARNIANPSTGERMRLPPSIGISFRAGKAEKERLHGSL